MSASLTIAPFRGQSATLTFSPVSPAQELSEDVSAISLEHILSFPREESNGRKVLSRAVLFSMCDFSLASGDLPGNGPQPCRDHECPRDEDSP